MTDAMLLATPDYKELTDTELARAVTCAKQRGRQTAMLVHAQAEEQERPDLHHKIGNFDLYLNHCVRVSGVDEDTIDGWMMKNAIETCDDPRMAWFCVIYQRTMWRLVGNDPFIAPVWMLRKIQDQQFRRLTQAQYAYSMQIAAIHQSGGSVRDPDNQGALQQLHSQFILHLDYAMLATMTLNVATEEWINEANHRNVSTSP